MKRLNLLERGIYPATAVVHWLDGTTSVDPAQMARITAPLEILFDTPAPADPEAPPADLRILRKPGGFALWQSGEGRIVAEAAVTAAAYDVGPRPGYRLRGSVSDSTQRYLPRRFDIAVPALAVTVPNVAQDVPDVVLYPSRLGTRVPTAGAVHGTLVWDADDLPVPWATVEITLVGPPTVVFRAESDAHGDFVLPLAEVPALREGITSHAVELRIFADTTAVPETWQAPADAVARQIGQVALGGSPDTDPATTPIPFSTVAAFAVQPGGLKRLRTIRQRPEVLRLAP